MKRIIKWVLVATLVCGASVFTSCNVDAIDNPVAPVKCPTITTQPKSVTYNIGDTKYPKMSVEAKSSAGDLKYEWFMEGEDGSYYSSGITTAELDLYAFIDNMKPFGIIEMCRTGIVALERGPQSMLEK